jgi:hypothetical protein
MYNRLYRDTISSRGRVVDEFKPALHAIEPPTDVV